MASREMRFGRARALLASDQDVDPETAIERLRKTRALNRDPGDVGLKGFTWKKVSCAGGAFFLIRY